MERKGIGTDASIPSHIENIQKRNYATLGNGRRLIPTQLGLVLAQGYQKIDATLVLPEVRAQIERECALIAKGEMEKEEVLKKSLYIFAEKFDYFTKNINLMDMLFSASFAKLEDSGKPFTRCGLPAAFHIEAHLQDSTIAKQR